MLPIAALFSLFSSDFMIFAGLAVAAVIGVVALFNNRGTVATKMQSLLPQQGESLLQTAMRDLRGVQGDALDLSQILAEEGLPLTSGLLKDVATGDLSTAAQHLTQIVATLRDPVRRSLVITNLLTRQIEKAIADPAKKQQLLALLEQKLGQIVKVGDPSDAKVS